MSASSPPRSADKIDVLGRTAQAYRTLLDHWTLAVELAWLPYILVLLAELLALALVGGGLFGLILSALMRGIGFLVFGTIFIVRWHRFVLLGERQAGPFFPPTWLAFVVTGFKLALIIFAGWIVLGLIATLPPHFLTGLIAFLGGIALSLGSMRVSLVFPAVAIERPISFRAAWDLLGGNYWRLVACALLCYLPFVAIQLILGRIGGLAPTFIWVVFEAAGLAVSFAGVTIVTSLVSEVYRQITGVAERLA